MDDITGDSLRELKEWFDIHHPDVPLCIYAYATSTRWNKEDWAIARSLIERRRWEIGGHTRTHPCLPLLTDKKMEDEIKGNICDIEQGLKNVGCEYRVKSFAYPAGEYDERAQKILREYGISFGLTYPDSFPYRSVYHLSHLLENPLAVGVTHTGEGHVDCWNRRFDLCRKLCRGEEGVYILALHPSYWNASITRAVRNSIANRSMNTLIQEIGLIIGSRFFSSKWKALNKHISYIKTFGDVKFTTFHELSRELSRD
jgi:peptidoglycan/xylan/chitin deacetylase (PgdA/CDA1 family)